MEVQLYLRQCLWDLSLLKIQEWYRSHEKFCTLRFYMDNFKGLILFMKLSQVTPDSCERYMVRVYAT